MGLATQPCIQESRVQIPVGALGVWTVSPFNTALNRHLGLDSLLKLKKE